MIQKILIAEDIDSINTGIITILKEKFDFEIEHANSCDVALLKIKKAIAINEPFDVLISDLSFKHDGNLTPVLKNGEDLVMAAKKEQTSLRTIIYTIEDNASLLKRLVDEIKVNSIVPKGLHSLNELCIAIEKVAVEEKYIPTEVMHLIKNDSTTAIESYDIKLLDLLADGLLQNEISTALKQQNISPSSVSAVEKRLSNLRSILKAKNNIQMIAIAKDMCII